MPEVTYERRLAVPVERIWDFVQDMNNWAPMLTGYQKHEILSDTKSIWTLKGDVGILSRTVRLEVNITEWNGPGRVAFTLTGQNEQVEGGGLFEMTTVTADTPAAVVAAPVSGFQRFLRWLFRGLFKRKFGEVTFTPAAAGAATASLRFTLRMDAGGPTGPLVNAMLEPALLPAAEDLGNKIAAHLTGAQGASPTQA